MLHPLRDGDRRRLLYVAAVLCTAPMLLLPLAGRSNFEIGDERAVFDRRFSAIVPARVEAKAAVTVTRDPFAPDEALESPSPKPGANGAVSVEAIVSGATPKALVEENARVRVVGIGDPLAGSRIVEINGAGLRLQNGTLLVIRDRGR